MIVRKLLLLLLFFFSFIFLIFFFFLFLLLFFLFSSFYFYFLLFIFNFFFLFLFFFFSFFFFSFSSFSLLVFSSPPFSSFLRLPFIQLIAELGDLQVSTDLCGKNENNDNKKPNFKNRWTIFRNNGMLRLLSLACHQGWPVYEINQKTRPFS